MLTNKLSPLFVLTEGGGLGVQPFGYDNNRGPMYVSEQHARETSMQNQRRTVWSLDFRLFTVPRSSELPLAENRIA